MKQFQPTTWIKSLKNNSSPWYHRDYIFDWVFAVVLFAIIQILSFTIEPFHRYLPENDATVDYPSTPDIVPDWALGIISPIIPVIFVIIGNKLFRKGGHDMHHAMLALAVGILMTNNVVTALKLTAGRYRPDWRNDETPDRQGRFSFPSGHAANAFAGMTFIVLYYSAKLKILSNKHTTSYAKVCAVTFPWTIAIFVAVSRTMDYHHHFSDILAGSIIGAFIATFSYFLYYPSLWNKYCEYPKHHHSLQPRWGDAEMATFPPKDIVAESTGDLNMITVV